MALWSLLVWEAVLVVTALVLRPKRQQEEERQDRSSARNAPEGTPVPMAFGRVRIDDPVTIWYGNLQRNTTPDNFAMTLHLGIALAPSLSTNPATLHRIWIGDTRWYDDSDNDLRDMGLPGGGIVHVDDGNGNLATSGFMEADRAAHFGFFGGDDSGGGFYGEFQWFGGSFSQDRPQLIRLTGEVPDSTLPAYRGLAHWAYTGNIGETPTLRPMSFEIETHPDALGQGEVGSSGDANPAEVLYELLRGDWGRLDLSSSQVDFTSFQTAAATLDAEAHGISLAITQGEARDAIQEILRQIDAVLYEEPSTRALMLKLIRDDYTEGSLPVFDPSNVSEVSQYVAAQLEPTANQVRVTYRNRAEEYQQRVVVSQDQASILELGRIKTADYTFLGVSNQTLALQLAARELQFLTRPLIEMRILADREAATLRPGDPILIAWPDYGITGLVMRVLGFDLGGLNDGKVTVNLAQDPFSVGFDVS